MELVRFVFEEADMAIFKEMTGRIDLDLVRGVAEEGRNN
jgi:hypothetical protein